MKEQSVVTSSVEEATERGATEESEQQIEEHDRTTDMEPCGPPDDDLLPGDGRGAPLPLPGESDYPGRD